MINIYIIKKIYIYLENVMTTNSIEEVKSKVIGLLDENKAKDISSIDLKNKTDIADYMIITSSISPRHSVALSDKVAKMLKENSVHIYGIEGKENGSWVLIDASDIIIHIFTQEVRELYQLEDMWSIPRLVKN